MKDLACWIIALFLAPIVAAGVYFVYPMVVSEIQPGFSEAFEDFTNRPTKTIEDNLGVAKIIVASWAGLMLLGVTVLPSTVNIGSAIVPWSFRLVGRVWRRTLGNQIFYQRLGSAHRNGILYTLIFLGSAFGVLVTTVVVIRAIIVGIGRIVLGAPAHVFLVIVRWVFGPVGRGWRRTQNFRYRLGSVYGNRILHSLILLGSAFGIFVTTH